MLFIKTSGITEVMPLALYYNFYFSPLMNEMTAFI